MFLFYSNYDGANGELRPFQAMKIGGEKVFNTLIADGSAIAYIKKWGPQFVRFPTHVWQNKTQLTASNTYGGVDHSRDKHGSLAGIADAFADSITNWTGGVSIDKSADDEMASIEFLNPRDSRVNQAHMLGLATNASFIPLTMDDSHGILV